VLREYWERLTSSSAGTQWAVLLIGGMFVTLLLALLVLAASNAVNPSAENPSAREASADGEATQASRPETTEQEPALQEPTHHSPTSPERADREKKAKPPPPPEPHTLPERVYWVLKKKNDEPKSTQVTVEPSPNGCTIVGVSYKTPFVGSTLPYEAADYHKAIYGDQELRHQICLVRTYAYGSTSDAYGNKKNVLLLRTSMGRRTAEKVNWEHPGSADFTRLYKIEYLAPSAKADMAREVARHAADCLEDEGMFDFDFDC
jgi:hypothetical protein